MGRGIFMRKRSRRRNVLWGRRRKGGKGNCTGAAGSPRLLQAGPTIRLLRPSAAAYNCSGPPPAVAALRAVDRRRDRDPRQERKSGRIVHAARERTARRPTRGGNSVTANTAALTPSLRSRLAAVARRVRILRVVRGLSLVALALLLTGGTALLADYLVALPAAVRLALFGGWVILGVGTLFVGLVLPLSRRLGAADLAAVVEQKYPELAERLTTTVELAQTGGRYHGSRAL